MNNLMLHICCGVCAGGIISALRERGYEVQGRFFNPNIHPYMEFLKRKKAVEVVAGILNVPIEIEDNYGLQYFLDEMQRRTVSDKWQRCAMCYYIRLEDTAKRAQQCGIENFATTLMISERQNHSLIREVGGRLSDMYNVNFVYFDAVFLYDDAKEFARKRSIYRQQYCGCVFSEYERYNNKK